MFMASLCRCLLLISDEFENNAVKDIEQVSHHISFLLSLLMCQCHSCTRTCTCTQKEDRLRGGGGGGSACTCTYMCMYMYIYVHVHGCVCNILLCYSLSLFSSISLFPSLLLPGYPLNKLIALTSTPNKGSLIEPPLPSSALKLKERDTLTAVSTK